MANWEIIHMATKLSMLGKHCILFECLLDGLKTPVCEENLRTYLTMYFKDLCGI